MSPLPSFKLEEYFTKYEFKAPFLFCTSDCEPYSCKEVLSLADSECLEMWESLSLGYTETEGLPLLRQEIAKQHGYLPSTHVLTHAGAEEAIYCTTKSLLKKNDHVIVLTPCYQSLEALPRSIGAEVTPIELDPAKEWALDLEKLEDALSPRTKMIITNYPHNPTGALLSKEEFHTLIALARKNNCYILSDEVYRFMEINPADRLPPITALYEKGISIGVMTKAYGLGGLRIGWSASQNQEAIKNIASYKNYTSICNASPSEALALIALRNQNTLLKRNQNICTSNLHHLDTFFENNKQLFSWTRPKGGCTGFVQLHAEIPVEQFAHNLLEQTGILILPSSIYSYPKNFFRIGFGRKNIPHILSLFEKYIQTI